MTDDRIDWSRAACRTYVKNGLDYWFEPTGEGSGSRESPTQAAERITRAKEVCAGCPLIEPCREAGLTADDGIYAGLTPMSRAARKEDHIGPHPNG